MTRRLFNIGAPSTVTHNSVAGSYSLVWETLSGISIPDEYLAVIGDTFLRLLRLEYNPNGVSYTSLAQFQTATTDSGTGSSRDPQMSDAWEKRDVAFTIIVGGNRYDVRGPDSAGVPSNLDDTAEPYYWRFSSGTSLGALTQAVQEADAATRASNSLEFDNGLADGVILISAPGTSTWVVPAGVTSLKVELVGGGGGSGASGRISTSGGSGKVGIASQFATVIANPGGRGTGGRSRNSGGQKGPDGLPGTAVSPGISGSGQLSGSRDIVGWEEYGKGDPPALQQLAVLLVLEEVLLIMLLKVILSRRGRHLIS